MFVHLHVHSHYSTLDGMSSIPELIDTAIAMGMPAIALTDHGNMFGVKELLDYAKKHKEIKPIVGCEVYVARRTRFDKDKAVKEDASGEHLVLLAKNKKGYQNLCKLVSLGWIEGHYYRPRVDKEILEKYSEGLIASSACLGGEIHKKIAANNYQGAVDAVLWYKKIFGDDYYIELQLHPADKPGGDTSTYEKQRVQNVELIKIARETNTKIIASNDVHFVKEEHAEAHDRLICLSTNKDLDDPTRMRYTKHEWLKSPQEMMALFSDLPEAIANTLEVAEKIEVYNIDSDAIMPVYPIPEDFATEQEYRERFSEEALRTEFGERFDKLGGAQKVYRIKLEADYLEQLAFRGAQERYGAGLTPDIEERIRFELETMKTMGFPGYFLIVHDLIREAREMHVSVGPGRGSAAGSVVAYCLRITDIDPLRYDLLFERFLNPDRISLPDIDIDFDDEGRAKVLDYVTKKYGKERVAHVITFGTMATKSSIKDVARVQKVPLQEVEKLTKLIPVKFPEDKDGKSPKVTVKNCIELIPELKAAAQSPNQNIVDTLKYATLLEGTVRQTGIHACGIIIGADDLTNYIPLSTVDDKETNEKKQVTQYEGTLVESVGLIKMDFLGLRTLSVIKDALKNIEKSTGITVDIDHIPLDDQPTYEIFSKGLTIGLFQFESPGMQKHLKELKPTQIEDIIAMNALYRPGPMKYISQFVKRKNGEEAITYPLPEMEKRLKSTYGITVYQEQVMLLSRDIAGFTRGQSDELRKAMGKKLVDKMASLREKFLTGAEKNGFTDTKKLEKIWEDWEEFAKYAFNKSHAVCYSWIAYQTAYLKAHYPAEFMAAGLSRNLSDITEITKLMDECKVMGIKVLSPDVNESNLTFTVNKDGNIRFGLAAVKGVGENVTRVIEEEREANGNFKSVFDFVERVKPQVLNKRVMESLVGSGAFDSLGIARPVFFVEQSNGGGSFVDTLLRYGALFQQGKDSMQQSLFGDAADTVQKPKIPVVAEYNQLEFLNRERDLIGIYLSSHPLDKFKLIMQAYTNTSLPELGQLETIKLKDIVVAGMVSKVQQLVAKSGNSYGKILIEDYSGSKEWVLFGAQYKEFFLEFAQGEYYMIHAAIQEKKSYGNLGLSQENTPKELYLNIKKVEKLSEVQKRGISSLKLKLPVEKVDDKFTDELYSLSIDNGEEKPKTDLFIHLYTDGMQIDCKAVKQKVSVSSYLLDFLEEQEVEYRLY